MKVHMHNLKQTKACSAMKSDFMVHISGISGVAAGCIRGVTDTGGLYLHFSV